jgi:hypothetical protein
MADLEQLVLSISADTRQMQKALAKLTGDIKKTSDDVDAAFGKAPPKIDNVAKSLNKTSFETANLAAQFQDIAVQLQGGQSPFTVALQQGTQISQVLGRSGATGAVSLLGTAFSSLLTPTSLATIGIIALGGAAVQYGAKAIGAVDDLDENLKSHAELIKGLKEAYGDAAKGIDLVARKSADVQATLLGFRTEDIQKNLRNLTGSMLASVTTFTQLGDAVGQFEETTSPKFKAFGGAVEALRDSFKNGTPDIRAFREAVSNIIDNSTDASVKSAGKSLLEMSTAANSAQEAILGTSKALRQLGPDALAAAEQGEAFAKAMGKLNATVTPNLDDRQKIMKNFTGAMEQASSTEERLAAARVRNDQLAILSYNDRKKAAEGAASEAESAAKRFKSALESTSRQTAKTIGGTPAIGQGVCALSKMEAI